MLLWSNRSSRLNHPAAWQKSRVWLIAATYACIMLFLHYMPYYINVILAYGIGISGAFLVMCLLDRVCISQKLFLSVTFFSLRWRAWRMVGELGLIWSPLCYRIFADRDEIFFFWLFVAECMRDALARLSTFVRQCTAFIENLW